MAAVNGSRKGTLYLGFFMVLLLTLFQSEIIHCWPEVPLLSRALRSIPQPVTTLRLYEPVYVPKFPYSGTLSEHLKVGSVIRVQGYVPENIREFQFNLCTDYTNGPIHLHIGIRFHEGVVVRNSFENRQWKTEERYGGVPFTANEEFVLLIEVRAQDYRIMVNGEEAWTFKHRVPYSTVEKLDIRGQPIPIWKIDYTDTSHQQTTQSLQPNGDIASSISTKAGENQVIEKFTLNLRCVCTPQGSASQSGSQFAPQEQPQIPNESINSISPS